MFLTALFLSPLLFSAICVADPAQESAQAIVDTFLKASVTNDTELFLSLFDPSFTATICKDTIKAEQLGQAHMQPIQGSRTAINAVLTGDVLTFDVLVQQHSTGPDNKISLEAKKGADGFKLTSLTLHGAKCGSPKVRKSARQAQNDDSDNYF